MKRKLRLQSGSSNLRILIGLVLLCIGLILGLLAVGLFSSVSVSAQRPIPHNTAGLAPSRTGVVQPRTSTGQIYQLPPKLTPDQLKRQEEELYEVNKLPTLPGNHENSPASNPPTKPNLSNKGLINLSGETTGSTDFIYRTIHDLSATEASSSRSVVGEPSVGSMGGTVVYSGNWYAARSADGGNSFTYVSPYTTFPSINGGFCCDQAVNYAPNQDMVLWALQYSRDATSGTLRIARAIGDAAVASNTWVYYDFNPQLLGFSTNNWLDFPNTTVSDNYLYVTSNVFDTVVGCPDQCRFNGSAIWRILLSQLAAGGTINFEYFSRTDVSALRCTEDAHTTMYWGALLSESQVRIHRWEDSSGTIFWDDVNIGSYSFLNRDGVATSPDGSNWAARADSRILGSWVANGIIGLMWSAKQGGSFPYPYTVVAQFNESDRTLVAQNQIWSTDSAWLYPTASVNSVSNLAGLLNYGGGPYYPGANIWVSDDVQNGFNPVALYGATVSDVGPYPDEWGDYQTVRKHKISRNTWVASTHYLAGDSRIGVPRYLWFGRQRDFVTPPIDFNGDGKTDFALFNPTTLQTALWYLNNNVFIGSANGPTPPVGWKLIDATDFNGDGKPDYLLVNSITGQTAIWYLSGVTKISTAYGPTAPSGWTLMAAADFNSDSYPDYLLYNATTRQTAIWYLRNNLFIGAAFGPTLVSGWQFVAAADFNSDGQNDLALFNPTTLLTAIWYLSGVTKISTAFGPTVPSGWQLAGAADFNSDGKPDYVLYKPSSRQTALWYLDNNVKISTAFAPTLTSGYVLAAP